MAAIEEHGRKEEPLCETHLAVSGFFFTIPTCFNSPPFAFLRKHTQTLKMSVTNTVQCAKHWQPILDCVLWKGDAGVAVLHARHTS